MTRTGQAGRGQGTHRFPETIIFVDMAILGEQLEAMTECHAPPHTLGQLRGLDVVHLPRLAVLKDHALTAQPQPPVVLVGEAGVRQGWLALHTGA